MGQRLGSPSASPVGSGLASVTSDVWDTPEYLTDKGYRGSAAATLSSAARAATGNGPTGITTSVQFYVTRAVNCRGIRFYWGTSGGARTIKCSLWDSGGSRVTSVTKAVNASGEYDATFAAVQALTAGSLYRASIWESTGADYCKATLSTANTYVPARPFPAGGPLVVMAVTHWANGDVHPTSVASTEAYFVEPMLCL
jgi:hypothetical protein